MVLMNLFARQQWRNRRREETCGHEEMETKGECMKRVTWKPTLPYVN